jgi:septal ring factor EnvC (AmiA/AmiB activator)
MKLTIQTTHEFNVTVNLPQLADFLAVLGGSSIPQTLARMENHMATFQENLTRLEAKLDEFDARELKEDDDHALSKAEVTRLTKELADLQAQLDAGETSPELQARFDALTARIDASNNIPSDVLPTEGDTPPAA